MEVFNFFHFVVQGTKSQILDWYVVITEGLLICKCIPCQVGCLQFRCYTVGANDRIHSVEQPKSIAGPENSTCLLDI